MELSMNEVLPMSHQMILKTLLNVISLQASVDGVTHSDLQDGEMIDPYGPVAPPCQPFSVAGKQKGKEDERHLWPTFFNLIRECQPSTVFGEQVASAIRNDWFDDLQIDMEREGYATGMVVLPACSVGAPHKRDRLWFVANSQCIRRGGRDKGSELTKIQRCEISENKTKGSCDFSIMADLINKRSQGRLQRGSSQEREIVNRYAGCSSTTSTLANSISHNNKQPFQRINGKENGETINDRSHVTESGQPWGTSQLIYCRDGKYRPIPVEPSLFPLANGISNRVGLLRGAGNAIVPEAAAEVISAFMDYKDVSFL